MSLCTSSKSPTPMNTSLKNEICTSAMAHRTHSHAADIAITRSFARAGPSGDSDSECTRQCRQVAAGDDAKGLFCCPAGLRDDQRGDRCSPLPAVSELGNCLSCRDATAYQLRAFMRFGEGEDAIDKLTFCQPFVEGQLVS